MGRGVVLTHRVDLCVSTLAAGLVGLPAVAVGLLVAQVAAVPAVAVPAVAVGPLVAQVVVVQVVVVVPVGAAALQGLPSMSTQDMAGGVCS